MTTENLEAVLRRVQKMLAIAEDDRADPNEAAAAASMAEKIMRKYQLEYADVIASKLAKGDDLSTADAVASAKTNGTKVKVVPLWAGQVAVAVGKLNDCGVRSCVTATGDAGVRFFGYSADVQVTQWMFEYLTATILRLCDAYKKTDAYAEGGRTVVNSYRQGVAAGICVKLAGMRKEKEAEAASAGTSLVVVKQGAITAKYGDFGYSKSKSRVDRRGDSFADGMRDGKAVDVAHRAVGTTAPVGRLN